MISQRHQFVCTEVRSATRPTSFLCYLSFGIFEILRLSQPLQLLDISVSRVKCAKKKKNADRNRNEQVERIWPELEENPSLFGGQEEIKNEPQAPR